MRPPESSNPASWGGLATGEPAVVRRLLVGVTLAFLGTFLVLPLAVVLLEALRAGIAAYLGAIAVPGILLATALVTFPYVAREFLPILEAAGGEEEEATVMLGASGWQTLWRATLPNVKWVHLYGVILGNARAMGEFGAVSVVSGHIRGLTDTLPLQVEILYNEYHPAAAFAVASLLAMLAVVTLIVKRVVEWRAVVVMNQGRVEPGGVPAPEESPGVRRRAGSLSLVGEARPSGGRSPSSMAWTIAARPIRGRNHYNEAIARSLLEVERRWARPRLRTKG